MAIFHCHVTPVSRRAGGNAKAAEEYITERKRGLAHVSDWCGGERMEREEASRVWSDIERGNKRCDARTALRVVIALPHECTPAEREQIVEEIAREISDEDVLVTAAIHEPHDEHAGDKRNVHAHLLVSTNRIGIDGKIEKKNRGLDSPRGIRYIRQAYEAATNRVLQRYGLRISGEPVRDRPTRQHLGPAATRLERAGVATAAGEHNRRIDELLRRPEGVLYVARETDATVAIYRDPEGRARVLVDSPAGREEVSDPGVAVGSVRVVAVCETAAALDVANPAAVWGARPPRDDEERHMLQLAASVARLSARAPDRQRDLARDLFRIVESGRERVLERDSPRRDGPERVRTRDDPRGRAR